jgi:hypothetical protein
MWRINSMRSIIKYFTMTMLLAMAMGTLSCGKKTKSDGARITLNPKRPVVITGKFSFDNNGSIVEVIGPWFKYNINVENKTDEEFVIVSAQLEITGVDGYGGFSTVKTTFDPSQSNFSTETLVCAYSTFGTWLPDEEKPVLSTSATPACNFPAGTAVTFFASGNPDPGTSQNFHYQGKLKLVGWFGTYTDATDRFEKTIYFTTQ